MAHTISIEDLESEFNYLVASSTKENKKLLISTIVDKEGKGSTTFDVKVKDQIFPFSELKGAIYYYNSIV